MRNWNRILHWVFVYYACLSCLFSWVRSHYIKLINQIKLCNHLFTRFLYYWRKKILKKMIKFVLYLQYFKYSVYIIETICIKKICYNQLVFLHSKFKRLSYNIYLWITSFFTLFYNFSLCCLGCPQN